MTKLALLKVLTGVAAVAATTTFVVTQTPVVDAHPAASAAPLVIAAPPVVDASIATREHPSSLVASLTADVSNAALLAAGASPDGAPPSDPAGGCEECQGECADADDLPLAPEVAALLAVDTPIGDPMDAIARFDLPRQGRADAKVSIVACSEFDCPFCKRATATLDEIRESYGDAVAVYWLNSPLPAHPGAVPAAAAGIAAAAQGKFWEIHDLLFARPEARSEDELVALAKELGLDVQRFRDDVRAPATLATIEEQQRTCFGNGAQGTPSFFVNGDLVVGAQPFESFAAIIDDELAQ